MGQKTAVEFPILTVVGDGLLNIVALGAQTELVGRTRPND